MIIAFEGPSGSGKDYKKNALIRSRNNIHTIVRQKMDRVVDKAAGAYLSSADDYAAVVAATMDTTRDVIVDRFLLSRTVYYAMQFNNNELERRWYHKMKASLNNIRSAAVAEAHSRVSEELIFLQPDVEIIVILPSLGQLEYRRYLSGKSYPYDGATELCLYTEIALHLIEMPLRGVTITLTQ